MTITLDDMLFLLHLSILDQFLTCVLLECGGAVSVLVELLGVDEGHGKAMSHHLCMTELGKKVLSGLLHLSLLGVCCKGILVASS